MNTLDLKSKCVQRKA